MVQRIRALATGAGAEHSAARPIRPAGRNGAQVAARTRPPGRAGAATVRTERARGASTEQMHSWFILVIVVSPKMDHEYIGPRTPYAEGRPLAIRA